MAQGDITGSNLVPALGRLAARRGFPMGYAATGGDPALWRDRVLPHLRALILPDLPAPAFAPEVLAEEDRPGGRIRLLRLTLTDGLTAQALFAVPRARGPVPAVLALHDHGSEFRIGAAKCLTPPGPLPQGAQGWWDRCFGGHPFGDTLLRRGYAVLAVDALNWGARAGNGYEAQQALAANLLQLGLSPAGIMAWEDLRAAEFLAAQPEVDAGRIAAVGFSMGAFRAWQVAALSPRVAGFVASCWMASLPGLLVEGNNQTRGQSAFWMTHPLVARDLDLPDIAALAAPKPGLFQWGRADALFPPAATEVARDKLAAVWAAHGAAGALCLQDHPGGHVFGPDRQAAAFDWLARAI